MFRLETYHLPPLLSDGRSNDREPGRDKVQARRKRGVTPHDASELNAKMEAVNSRTTAPIFENDVFRSQQLENQYGSRQGCEERKPDHPDAASAILVPQREGKEIQE
jgi:hypothetical protein